MAWQSLRLEGSSTGELLMGGCVRQPLSRIARLLRAARMRLTLPVKVGGLGVMLKRRCFCMCGPRCRDSRCNGQLLEASAAEAAWNFCAPVVDYDALRKDVAAVFADKTVEVQGWVAKLQKTQRAVEQTLDKCACMPRSDLPRLFCPACDPHVQGMRRLARLEPACPHDWGRSGNVSPRAFQKHIVTARPLLMHVCAHACVLLAVQWWC